jgi:hypothetical protein
MALPALQQKAAFAAPGSPAEGKRDLLPGAGAGSSADTAKRRADDSRRLRRVKDSKEQLKRRTRQRGASNGTIDTTTTTNSISGGRSYTVANVHNGVIYLRYAIANTSLGCPFLLVLLLLLLLLILLLLLLLLVL